MEIKFNCVKCGLCCMQVGLISKELDRGDGACINLAKDNSCFIYETRPFFCRIDDGRPSSVSVELWHKLNKESCIKLGAKFE